MNLLAFNRSVESLRQELSSLDKLFSILRASPEHQVYEPLTVKLLTSIFTGLRAPFLILREANCDLSYTPLSIEQKELCQLFQMHGEFPEFVYSWIDSEEILDWREALNQAAANTVVNWTTYDSTAVRRLSNQLPGHKLIFTEGNTIWEDRHLLKVVAQYTDRTILTMDEQDSSAWKNQRRWMRELTDSESARLIIACWNNSKRSAPVRFLTAEEFTDYAANRGAAH
ncbi:MAG: hypothetical protein FH754_00210 [Marinobacter sp.]|nr:hypothetical protein [Marinobacter sp.]